MKILLDHNLDRRLKHYLAAHEVSTAQEHGWGDVLNGELISLLEANGFDVLVTADSKLKDQQNLADRDIAVLVLRAPDNRLATHIQIIDEILSAIPTVKRGRALEIFHPRLRRTG